MRTSMRVNGHARPPVQTGAERRRGGQAAGSPDAPRLEHQTCRIQDPGRCLSSEVAVVAGDAVEHLPGRGAHRGDGLELREHLLVPRHVDAVGDRGCSALGADDDRVGVVEVESVPRENVAGAENGMMPTSTFGRSIAALMAAICSSITSGLPACQRSAPSLMSSTARGTWSRRVAWRCSRAVTASSTSGPDTAAPNTRRA